MHIVRLEAQNIQRLTAVTIEPSPDSSALVLAGGNEEGKSSVLDAIEMALAGEKVLPPEPIRRGQEKAHVVVDLQDIIVKRTFTSKGSSLTVTNREGLKYPSPQALLDALYNRLTFDPLAFAQSRPSEQAETLRKLAGLDTADLDAKRKAEFDARTLVNRDVANAKGAIEKAAHYPDAGDELVDTAAVLEELAAADRLAEAAAAADRNHQAAIATARVASSSHERAKAALESAKAALRQAERDFANSEKSDKELNAAVGVAQTASFEAAAAVPDRAELREKVKRVQFKNAQVEANRRRKGLAEELERVQATAAAHTKAIELLDVEKASRLADAKFPIEGLGLNGAGVTWNELPFEQASTAIRTRVSVAIGFALHPKLKVLLVRNGNDLDGKNLQLIADAAKEQGGQLWIERIAGGNGLQTVEIQDGAVKGAEPTVPPPQSPEELQSQAAALEDGSKKRAVKKGGLAGLPLEEGSPK
jgi:Tfp pilus assembly protein PilX